MINNSIYKNIFTKTSAVRLLSLGTLSVCLTKLAVENAVHMFNALAIMNCTIQFEVKMFLSLLFLSFEIV